MRILKSTFILGAWLFICSVWVVAAEQTAEVRFDFAESPGPMRIEQMALGQGGLSELPMWGDRVAEIRALRPKIIRLFIQEYFDLLPERGHYSFSRLDAVVDTILATGASPLMCICFKPRTLFPEVNQDIVEPADYAAWDDLIYNLVKHYRERNSDIRYWEVGNEPDIGEDGGCPYRFKPETYNRYYGHTAASIMRADPQARVGGPALANSRSPILPALLSFCSTNQVPLHFVSWHIYSSDPKAVRGTVDYVKDLLKQFPDLKLETFLDEWNMDLMNPPLDPGFQPCFILESIAQMKAGGLDYSCYYHIRDWYVSPETFARFMSPQGTAFMARWWNRMPQFDGLFDYQNTIRPSYFAFKLLSRIAGEQLQFRSSLPQVNGLAARDQSLRMHNLLLWNYSSEPVQVRVTLENLPKDMRIRHVVMDAKTTSSDENARLRPDPFSNLSKTNASLTVTLEPYGIHYWSLE